MQLTVSIESDVADDLPLGSFIVTPRNDGRPHHIYEASQHIRMSWLSSYYFGAAHFGCVRDRYCVGDQLRVIRIMHTGDSMLFASGVYRECRLSEGI